jgi:uncharacterized protein (TIGR03382 family)
VLRVLTALAASLVLATGLVLGVGIAVPRLAHACSCVAPQPLAAYAGPDNVILAGQVTGPDGGGVQVGVERWFSGDHASPVVRIAADFGNGGSCGIGFVPDQGSRWIWVLWRPEVEDPLGELAANDNLQVNICQPYGDLATPEGRALFTEAVKTFGDGGEATSAPAVPVPPEPTQAAAPGAPDAATVSTIAVGGVIAVGALVLALVVLLSRRRPAG